MKHWKKTAAIGAFLLTVSAIPAFAQGEIEPISAPDTAPVEAAPIAALKIAGPVVYVDLEGGFYAVDGWRLHGPHDYSQYLGKNVIVTGTEFTGMSIFMVKAINVETIQLAPVEVPAALPVPDAIRIDGKPVAMDQGPVAVDGVLLVPLRPVAEAAGGVVTWDGELRQVHVRMPDRTVVIRIDDKEADVYADGVQDAGRNRVEMAQPARILDARTMISADALSTVLGLMQAEAEEGVLSLVAAPYAGVTQPLPGPAPEEEVAPEQSRIVGRVIAVEEGRILLEGEPMASGEPFQVWLTVAPETPIIVGEGTGTFADLKEGVWVQATVTGPLLMSYPARGAADEIEVLPEAPPSAPEEGEAAPQDRILGTVKEIEEGRILLEGGPMASGEPFLVWLAVTPETPITIGEAAGTFADLKVGDRVEATVTGPLLMSYPAQGGADAIRVLTDEPAAPAEEAQEVSGTIAEVGEGRILVRDYYLLIREVTEIVRLAEDGTEQPAAAQDLKVGLAVRALFTGPVMESYPMQVVADKIIIVGEGLPD